MVYDEGICICGGTIFDSKTIKKSNLPRAFLFLYSFGMGNSSTIMATRYQQHPYNRRSVLHTLYDYYWAFSERLKSKMSKVAFILLNAASLGGYGLIILLNIADAKAWVLFCIAALYGGARLFFYIVKANQDRQMRQMDIQERKLKIASKKH